MAETNIDERPTHTPEGKFAKNNKWMMPAWKPGESGHVARFTPKRLANLCQSYLDDPEMKHKREVTKDGRVIEWDEPKRPTWAGLARYLGISRQALDKYRAGEIGVDSAAIVGVLDYMRTQIEADLEAQLTDKDYATAGVVFALKQHGWKDERHMTVDSVVNQRLIVQLDPELKAQLERQAGEVFEGEFKAI